MDPSRRILTQLENIFPDDPLVLLNLMALEIRCHDVDTAKRHFSRINQDDLTPQGRDALELLDRSIKLLEVKDAIRDMTRWDFFGGNEARIEIEKKPLPVNPAIGRGLKNMPAQWLDATCAGLGLERERMRKQREKAIAEHLADVSELRELVSGLKAEERGLLAYLSKRGGWARLNVVTRMFGGMEADGCCWSKTPPVSALGRLWVLGLVFVG